MDFTHYYGKHRRKNNVWTQTNVDTKNDLLKLRIDGKLKNRIMDLAKDKNKSASELTRLLWVDYFKKVDDRAWRDEVNNF